MQVCKINKLLQKLLSPKLSKSEFAEAEQGKLILK